MTDSENFAPLKSQNITPSFELTSDISLQIRKMVDGVFEFTKELQNQAPFLNDLLEQCARHEEQVNSTCFILNRDFNIF